VSAPPITSTTGASRSAFWRNTPGNAPASHDNWKNVAGVRSSSIEATNALWCFAYCVANGAPRGEANCQDERCAANALSRASPAARRHPRAFHATWISSSLPRSAGVVC
jgi:hypothetical protein